MYVLLTISHRHTTTRHQELPDVLETSSARSEDDATVQTRDSMASRPLLPTHAEYATFVETFLPPLINVTDVQYLYHTPRHPAYNPVKNHFSRVILSITPTPGFYKALNGSHVRYAPVCFLHRPWSLDRRQVRRGSMILASHQSFDSHLTVGWNTRLAQRLGCKLDGAFCIQGYKGNDDRKIGLVAQLEQPSTLAHLVGKIKREFAGVSDLHLPSDNVTEDTEINCIAIMNAFHQEEVERVLTAAHQKAWSDVWANGQHILYLTGAAREPGLEAVKHYNMPALCVGHRACEEWGIRMLAEETRLRWPELEVIEVLEEEDPPPSKKPKVANAEQSRSDSKQATTAD